MLGGKKIYKTVKTKFKEHQEGNISSKQKRKQHDKVAYRLLRQQQKDDYVV
jgi:hypothetical protein